MKVKVKIDGKEFDATKGEFIIDVAKRNNIKIPSLCHHPALSPHASCRICIVELEQQGKKGKRIVTSCNYPVKGGEVISTKSEGIFKLRKILIEYLLSMAPKSEVLQKLAYEYKVKKIRFDSPGTATNCILCGLCVRACEEISGASVINFSSRGWWRGVETLKAQENASCIACAVCSEICPTQAITTEKSAIGKLKKLSGTGRWCRYHLMGISQGALCSMNYNCDRCDVEFFWREHFGGHPLIVTAMEKRKVK